MFENERFLEQCLFVYKKIIIYLVMLIKNNMDGVFKKIVLVFICLLFVCCKDKHYEEHIKLLKEARLKEKEANLQQKELIEEGRKLIQQNCNILIDSIFVFDIKGLDPKVKEEKLTVGLIDSIYYKNTGSSSDKQIISFKLQKEDLANFKSEYELHLVQNMNQNGRLNEKILYIEFSNFRIYNNDAKIKVKKVSGIGFEEATFFFEKKNNVWVFRRKIVSGDIG